MTYARDCASNAWSEPFDCKAYIDFVDSGLGHSMVNGMTESTPRKKPGLKQSNTFKSHYDSLFQPFFVRLARFYGYKDDKTTAKL